MEQEFVDVLCAHLPRTGGAELSPSSDLREFGLDSMRSIELLFAVEDTFGVVLPDDRLTDDTFRTPGALWSAIEAARAQANT